MLVQDLCIQRDVIQKMFDAHELKYANDIHVDPKFEKHVRIV